MEVICLEDRAFYALVEEVVSHIREKFGEKDEWKWVDDKEAMRLLNCKESNLQKLRDEGKITFTQPQPKIILYDRDSIAAHLEKHKRKNF